MGRLRTVGPRLKAAPPRLQSAREPASKPGGKWLYGRRWRKARVLFLQANPLCAHCTRQGRTGAATDVDHVIPHKGDERLFWDETNWQPLCKAHHSTKTAKEDGGFNNPMGKQ